MTLQNGGWGYEPKDGERFVSSMGDGSEHEPSHYHRLFDCPKPVLYGDGSPAYCDCKPPLEDFENGYANELGTCWSGLDWRERANANPLNMDLFLRCRYGQPFTATFEHGMKRAIEKKFGVELEAIATRDSPLLTMLKKPSPTVVSPQLYAEIEHEMQTHQHADKHHPLQGTEFDPVHWVTRTKPNRAERRRMAALKRRAKR